MYEVSDFTKEQKDEWKNWLEKMNFFATQEVLDAIWEIPFNTGFHEGTESSRKQYVQNIRLGMKLEGLIK